MGVEEEEEVDGSFKKPGAIPFKWETRPGVPKPDPQPQPPLSYSDNNKEEEEENYTSHSSSPSTPQYLSLTPPPRTQSLRSISRLRSNVQWYDPDPDPGPPLLARPESISAGCFLSPRLRWKWGWKKLAAKTKPKLEPKSEPEPKSDDHGSKFERLARWSVSSTRKSLSLSPLHRSSSLSFSSNRSGSSP